MAAAKAPDLLDAIADAHEEAAEGKPELGPVLLAIHRLQADGWVTPAEMLADPECRSALLILFPTKDGAQHDPQGLGKVLPGYQDNSAAGLTLRLKEGKNVKGKRFKAYRVEGDPEKYELLM